MFHMVGEYITYLYVQNASSLFIFIYIRYSTRRRCAFCSYGLVECIVVQF